MTKSDSLRGRSYVAVVACALASVSPLASVPAWSQEQGGLDDTIIVTATRRSTDIQDVPFAISAVSGEALENLQVTDIEDFAVRFPAVNLFSAGPGNNFLSIRGASVGDDSPGVDQGVAVFVDDVVTTSTVDLAQDLFDLDRVEVLRGPQGTYFGRNVTGGAILIYTRKPQREFDFRAQATAGTDDTYGLSALVTGPLSDAAAAKLSVSRSVSDGHFEKASNGDRYGELDRLSARAQLLVDVTPNLSLTVGGDYFRDRSEAQPSGLVLNFTPQLFPGIVSDPDVVNFDSPADNNIDVIGTFARLEWETAVGDLTSITGYRNVDSIVTVVSAADPGRVATTEGVEKDKQFTQEIRLASSGERAIDWLAGAYYISGSKDRDENIRFNFVPGQFIPTAFRLPQLAFPALIAQSVDVESVAGFGGLDWHVTDALTLSAGARYTWERKSGSANKTPANLFVGPGISATFLEDWSAFTPKFTASYEPSEDLLLFATASRGFKSGGFNFTGSNAAALRTPFDPEYAWNYEAGFKSVFLDNRVRLNASIYNMDYTDLQVRSYDPAALSFTTSNAGKARVRGADLEVDVAPTDWLRFGGTYAYQDAEYTRYVVTGPTGAVTQNFTGNRLPYTPRHSGGLFSELTFEAPGGGSINAHADVSFRSNIWLSEGNAELPFVHRLTGNDGLVNLRLAWRSADDRWEVAAWGRNVTDERFPHLAADIASLLQSTAEAVSPFREAAYVTYWNEPATYGLTVTFKLK